MRRTLFIVLACAALAGCGGSGGSSSGPPTALLHPDKLKAKAPQLFTVVFKTTKGTFVGQVHRTWAPIGADRFYNLVKKHFFDGDKFFRVVPGFVAQFGISPYPAVSKAWQSETIPICHAAPSDRSAMRPATKGPRSLTVTTTLRWFSRFVTRTRVPNGSVRCSIVGAVGIEG